MAVTSFPSSNGSLSLQRTITTSGWVDLGDPRLIYFVLAGGGGGGGGSANFTSYGGGGGGGGAGAVAGRLFIGGKVYVQIGAGGTAGAAGATGVGTYGGTGGNSYLGVPYQVSNSAAASGMYWIGAVGGNGGANGSTAALPNPSATGRASLDATGRPSVTGYTAINTVSIACGGGKGGGGGSADGNGNWGNDASSYYPNVNKNEYALTLTGWANNDMRYFAGASATANQGTYVGGIFGIDWTEQRANFQNPTSATYSAPYTLWTTGTSAEKSLADGGTGGSLQNQPVGLNGVGGLFTGGGGGGSSTDYMSGSGGHSSMSRGGESSRMFGNATNYGGGGGAGILKSGSDGIVAVSGSTGGKGGDGGFGGGGGGGSQCNSTGVTGGVGGQGALALFW